MRTSPEALAEGPAQGFVELLRLTDRQTGRPTDWLIALIGSLILIGLGWCGGVRAI